MMLSSLIMSYSLGPRGEGPPAPPSMGFPRQEFWSGLPSPSPGDLPDPGMEHRSPAFAGRFFTTEQLEKPINLHYEKLQLGMRSEIRKEVGKSEGKCIHKNHGKFP